MISHVLQFIQKPKDKTQTFNTRNFKKDNPAFLQEYNTTELIWNIFRVRGKELLEGNIGVVQSAVNFITKEVDNLTVLDALNNNKALTTNSIVDGDYLIIKEKFIFEAIKNVPRRPGGNYLQFRYLNNKWTIANDFMHFEEIEDVDNGVVLIKK